MVGRSIIHVLPAIKVPLRDARLGRVGYALLNFTKLPVCQKPNSFVGADVECLSQNLSKIVTYAFYLTDGNNYLLAALNVLAGDSKDVLILGCGQIPVITKQIRQ